MALRRNKPTRDNLGAPNRLVIGNNHYRVAWLTARLHSQCRQRRVIGVPARLARNKKAACKAAAVLQSEIEQVYRHSTLVIS